MHSDTNQKEGTCKRCGTCCCSGGPALHIEDRELVMEARLLPVHLITYRKGEPAWDPSKRELVALPQEMIKIRTVEGSTTCILYNSSDAACSIYEQRPVECRALKCWDTTDIEALFLKDLLQRDMLFSGSGTLKQLVDAYEKAIPVEDILFFCNVVKTADAEETGRALSHMKLVEKVDTEFRQKACETLGLGRDDLLFYFGSPAKDIFERVSGLSEPS